MAEHSLITDGIIYQEMMSHPALFSHPRPKSVAIIGDNGFGILEEVLRHPNITHICHVLELATSQKIKNPKVDFIIGDQESWLKSATPESFDIIIVAQDSKPEFFNYYHKLLHIDGLLIQQSDSLFNIETLKSLQQDFTKSEFTDVNFLSFHQSGFQSGWRTALIAIKYGNLKRAREKDIFNKTFNTRYYNYDIHKAALALPQFMRDELEPSIE